MTTEPDPQLVREIARKAALLAAYRIDDVDTAIDRSGVIGDRPVDVRELPAWRQARGVLYGAVREELRRAQVTVSWPDEQTQAECDAAAKFAMDMERLEKNDPAGTQWLKGILAERVEPESDTDSCIHCGRDFGLPYVTRQTGTNRCEDCTATCGFPGCGHPDHQRTEQAQAERDADVRAVARLKAADVVDFKSASIEEWFAASSALYARFADRITALREREQEGGAGCPCGCPAVADMCSCPEPCPCEPDCAYCLTPNPMRQPDGGAS